MIDSLLDVSDTSLYCIFSSDYRIIYTNAFFKTTIDTTIGSGHLLEFIHEQDRGKFEKAIKGKSNNVSVRLKTKGFQFELFRITHKLLFKNHFQMGGYVLTDSNAELRDENKRMNKLLKNIAHFMNHELWSQCVKVNGARQLLEMVSTDEEKAKANKIIDDAMGVIKEFIQENNIITI